MTNTFEVDENFSMKNDKSLMNWLESLTQEERVRLFEAGTKELEIKEHYHKLIVNGQPFEAFDLIDAMAPYVDVRYKFYFDNLIKYIIRFPFKEQEESDLHKIIDYSNEILKRLDKQEG